jgi:hypothetical protein
MGKYGTLSDVIFIPITEPFSQLTTNTSDFISQVHLKFMRAVGQGQTPGKFNTLNTDNMAMQKGEASEPMS